MDDGKTLENTQDLMPWIGGRIVVRRCKAKSKRTGLRCCQPVAKGKEWVCYTHGGRSTGPRTAEGKAKIAAAQFKHGERSKAAEQARAAAFKRYLEAARRMRHLMQLARRFGLIG